MRPSVRRRVLPVARPKIFLAAALAPSSLWAIFLCMLIASYLYSLRILSFQGSQLAAEDAPNELDRRLSAFAADARCGRLSTVRPTTEEGTPHPPRSGRGRRRVHR